MNFYNEETHPDQMYFLSDECENKLSNIHPGLAEVVRRAQAIADIQLVVIHGKRTASEQEEFFRKGVTSGNMSPHLYGTAVDILPMIHGRFSPEAEAADEVATVMRYAADDLNIPIRWGGAWHINDITQWTGLMEDLSAAYLEHSVMEGIRPQLDTHHFEMSIAE